MNKAKAKRDLIKADVWEEMRGYDFELTENTGVHHYDMLADAELLTRLLSHLQ